MSLKDLEIHIQALAAYDSQDYESALDYFEKIQDSSKVRFNIAVIFATLGEHEQATIFFQKAIQLDRYLAIAYFQAGVSNFLLGDFQEALANFNDALLYLRGNTMIDYRQLGLQFRLYSCEVLFNRGLCYLQMHDLDTGLNDLKYSAKEKQIVEHDVIDEAIRDQADGYTVFSIPVGCIFRPGEQKIRNMAAKDYLGKARLVAATEASDAFTGFTGVARRDLLAPQAIEKKPESFAASNLVKADLRSRTGSLIPNQVLERSTSLQSKPSQPLSAETIHRRPSAPTYPLTPPPDRAMKSRNGYSQSLSATSDSSDKSQEDRGAQLYLSRSHSLRSESVPQERSLSRSESSVSRDRSYFKEERDSKQRTPSKVVQTPAKQGIRNAAPKRSQSAFTHKETLSNMASQQRGRADYARDYTDLLAEYQDEDHSGEAKFEYVRPHSNEQHLGDVTPPTIKRIKVKVHARGQDESRIITLEPYISVKEFAMKIQDKLRLPRMLLRDEDNEMILLADQEDMDHACEVAITGAEKERKDFGRMVIWTD